MGMVVLVLVIMLISKDRELVVLLRQEQFYQIYRQCCTHKRSLATVSGADSGKDRNHIEGNAGLPVKTKEVLLIIDCTRF